MTISPVCDNGNLVGGKATKGAGTVLELDGWALEPAGRRSEQAEGAKSQQIGVQSQLGRR